MRKPRSTNLDQLAQSLPLFDELDCASIDTVTNTRLQASQLWTEVVGDRKKRKIP
jgi:hypothetical protein